MSLFYRIVSYLTISLVFVSAIPHEAVAQEDVRISRNLDRKLKRDAARLALRMENADDLRYQSIQIPVGRMNTIYDNLVTLYKEEDGIRSIFRCNVHTRPDPSIDHMLVIFDRSVEWARPLRDGMHETNSMEINDLLYEYDLIIEKHVQWDDTHDAIAIRSKKPLNMAALSNEFYNVEGVGEIDLGVAKPIGNNIVATRVRDGWRFEFILAFGSLAQKGEKSYRWQYELRDTGEVIKISEGGDPIPEWMRCETTFENAFARG